MIIKHTREAASPQVPILNQYPYPLTLESEKGTDDYIKRTVDYFTNIAYAQYEQNRKTFGRNYDLVKGKLTPQDLFEEVAESSFMAETNKKDVLPSYVKSFSILNNPLNTLSGELSERPDNTLVKSFDDDSKSEEMQFMTSILQEYVVSNALNKIYTQYAEQGIELSEEELQVLTEKEVAEELSTYTSMAEKWASKILTTLKVRFSLKEKQEEAFRDLATSAREYFHIYEDNSDIGFNVKVTNTVNTWLLKTPSQKYTADPFDLSAGAFAIGTIDVLELSEILQIVNLTVEEIECLSDASNEVNLISSQESNLFRNVTGEESITYNTYDPLLYERQLLAEASLANGAGNFDTYFDSPNSPGVYGTKHVLVQGYYQGKKKIGKVTYIDIDGQPVTTYVDENYTKHPQEVDIEWGWTNQWYKFMKIGQWIYYHNPYEMLPYAPIIGSFYEPKNADPASIVDLLKPFQSLHNIYYSKLYESITKDQGKILVFPTRHIPIPEDATPEEAVEIWKAQAKQEGIVFTDDSPENTKSPSSFNQYTVHDASRVAEMQGYWEMAENIKMSAWELVGITKQRMGTVQATETATATNTALSQSYAQTEPWFAHHEYTMNKVYQGILDAAIYTVITKPDSSLAVLSTPGEQGFLVINGGYLKLKDIHVYVTSRAEDARIFRELKSYAPALLQAGATTYEVAMLSATQSTRKIMDIYKQNHDKLKELEERQQALQEQQLQEQQEFNQQQLAAQQEIDNLNRQERQYEAEQDRINKKEVAIINAQKFGKVQGEDLNNDGVPDVLEASKLDIQRSQVQNDYQVQQQKTLNDREALRQKQKESQDKVLLELEKLKVQREKMANDLKIARENTLPHERKKK